MIPRFPMKIITFLHNRIFSYHFFVLIEDKKRDSPEPLKNFSVRNVSTASRNVLKYLLHFSVTQTQEFRGFFPRNV
jgi:hypothetical protein